MMDLLFLAATAGFFAGNREAVVRAEVMPIGVSDVPVAAAQAWQLFPTTSHELGRWAQAVMGLGVGLRTR